MFNKIERPSVILAVYLIVIKDSKTLLYLRQNSGFCDNMYGVIAGHVEKGESVTEAVIREAKEEAGINIEKKHLKSICSMHRLSDSERVDCFFQLVDWDGEFVNVEPNKCKELKFFDINNLPENTIEFVKDVIVNLSEVAPVCEYGWNK